MKKVKSKCPYCNHPYKALGLIVDVVYDDNGEGIFVKDGKLIALADCGCIRFEQKINVCPMRGRTLEEKA